MTSPIEEAVRRLDEGWAEDMDDVCVQLVKDGVIQRGDATKEFRSKVALAHITLVANGESLRYNREHKRRAARGIPCMACGTMQENEGDCRCYV